jgi:hypothetical protein
MDGKPSGSSHGNWLGRMLCAVAPMVGMAAWAERLIVHQWIHGDRTWHAELGKGSLMFMFWLCVAATLTSIILCRTIWSKLLAAALPGSFLAWIVFAPHGPSMWNRI